jgi:hypothetical protein
MPKKREWKCMYCDRYYVGLSQICPVCHRVMIEKEKAGKKVALYERR